MTGVHCSTTGSGKTLTYIDSSYFLHLKNLRDRQNSALADLRPELHPATLSRRLTEWAARILPAADQSNYAELFRSELCDLAQAGCGRRAQFAYAIRVLVRAPLLRRALRA